MINIISKHLNDLNEKDVKAIISFGSLHLGTFIQNNNDEFSDLDLFVFTKTPNKLLSVNNIGWLKCFGNPISILTIKNPVEGNMITRIMFENLFCVDVIPISYNKFKMIKIYLFLKKIRLNKLLSNYINIENELKTFCTYLKRDYTIIYDKKNIKNIVNKINKNFSINEEKLSENIFFECYHEFWQTTYRFLGKIIRNDTYYGLILLDNVLKKRLVEMIEWEARYFYNSEKDLFYYGKKINLWADNFTLSCLSKTTFSLDEKENLEILQNHILLFQKSCKNVCLKKGYIINKDLEDKISAKINQYIKS